MKANYNELIIRQLLAQNASQFIERLALALDQSNYEGDKILNSLVEGVVKNVCINCESDYEVWVESVRNNNPSLTITFEEPERNGLNE